MPSPILLWFRRDLRLGDHPALSEACASGRPVIPVFVHDEVVETTGAAAKWRLGLSVASLAESLAGKGSRLVLRRGRANEVLARLVEETGAGAVWSSRAHDPAGRARDEAVRSALAVEVRDFPGHVLFEPSTVETGSGGYYKVFTPYWKAVRTRDPGTPLPAPSRVPAPEAWPASDDLKDWNMGRAMNRGADVLARHATVGESAASHRLAAFMAEKVENYAEARDMLAVDYTSNLSENLTCGEISARSCWASGWRAVEEGRRGAETFVKELVWRDFAYHLLWHTPHIATRNWRPEWDGFPWKDDAQSAEAVAWTRGRTGMAIVDAAMREMFVTGRMHNRGRMIVASYLTKHLMTHWKVGQAWFDDCLTDWDPASNAMGWQWSAGSGPDATPFFRVFNPETQAEKFDPQGSYRRRWIAEGQDDPPETALSYFDATPRRWGLSPGDAYPESPIVGAAEGRAAALEAYRGR